ncbi:glycosyltransferase [bacterium]|nr:glycosyltransferase [bacterium]
MLKKSISVIIPCYNVEKYISYCLDSVINQTYKNLEIICVNDGSTDGTLSVLEEYAKKDNRIRIIDKKNEGVAIARNVAIKTCKSEYITFVDSDDWIFPETYEVAISKMTDDVDLVCWGFNVINDRGTHNAAYARRFFNNFALDDGKYVMDKNKYFKDFYYNISVWNKLYKKSIIDKYNIEFPNNKVNEEFIFNFTYLLYVHKFYNITEKFYNYRKTENSLTASMEKRKAKTLNDLTEIKNMYLLHKLFVDNSCWEECKSVIITLLENFFYLYSNVIKSSKKVSETLRQAVIDCDMENYPSRGISLLVERKYKELKKAYKTIKDSSHIVSIIVPVYNKEQYLSRCLDSLISQTYKNIEIICVDDASDDSSLYILKEYAKTDCRIKVLKNDKNMGVGYTRQKGLDASTADYIMWCDADDSFELNCVEKMFKTILKYDVDIVECLPNYNNNFLVKSREDFAFGTHLCKRGKSEVDLFVNKYSFKSLWGHIFKRSIIEVNGIKFCDELKTHEDFVFVHLYLMKAKSIYFLEERLYNYFVVLNSLIDKFHKENVIYSYGEFIAFKNVVDFVRRHNWKDKFYICNEISYTLSNYFLKNVINYSPKFGRELVDKISKSEILPFASKYFPQEMNVVFASDDNYAEPLCVAIASILKNSPNKDRFNFYILDCGISDLNKKNIESLTSISKCNIKFLKVENELFDKFDISDNADYISKATYARYLIPILKPELKKCLYLDCDIVVRKPLRELYNTDLGDNYVGAVEDAYIGSTSSLKEFYSYNPSYNETLSIIKFKEKYKIGRYFNAGVLLINLKKWQKENITDKLFKATKKLRNDLVLNDQDVMNYLFKDKTKFLNIGYNAQECFYTLNVVEYSKSESESKVKNIYYKNDPAIVHYSNKEKPWNSICAHPFRSLYFYYLNFTPFRENSGKYLDKIIKKIYEQK